MSPPSLFTSPMQDRPIVGEEQEQNAEENQAQDVDEQKRGLGEEPVGQKKGEVSSSEDKFNDSDDSETIVGDDFSEEVAA